MLKLNLSCALVFSMLLGCASAPKDVGYGQYGYFLSGSGNVFAQFTHPSGFQCENFIKSAWSSLAGNGNTGRCGDQNKEDSLPWSFSVSGLTSSDAFTKASFAIEADCRNVEKGTLDLQNKLGGVVTRSCSKQ